MLFKKKLTLVLLAFSFFGMLVSSTRVEVFASSFTVETDFLTSSTWFDASNQEVVGDTITGSPYTILTNGYKYIFSVGSNDINSSRVLFGAQTKLLSNEYANFDHPNLTAFGSISRGHTFEGVITLFDSLYYAKVTSIQLLWGNGSAPDGYLSNMIYSLDKGTTWNILGSNQTITPGSSAGSFTFNETIQSSYLNVGLLLTNNVNTNAIYIQNPELTITYSLLTDSEQANQFASEIEDYSPCATEKNNMLQLTNTKQAEFTDKYNRLSTNAKNLLSTITMGTGFTAADRYHYLSSFIL
jgi:hypothetical protein